MKNSIRLCLLVAFASILIVKTEASEDEVCVKENQVYSSCGTSCPETCEMVLGNPPSQMCTMQCVPGCFCKDDYVIDTATDQCVKREHCKMTPNDVPIPQITRSVINSAGTITASVVLVCLVMAFGLLR